MYNNLIDEYVIIKCLEINKIVYILWFTNFPIYSQIKKMAILFKLIINLDVLHNKYFSISSVYYYIKLVYL